MMKMHVFADNPLDRGERERRDEDWISQQITQPGTKFLVIFGPKVLISTSPDPGLAWASNEELTGRRDELEIQKEQLKSDQINGKQKLAEVSSSIAHAEKNVGKLRQAIKSVTPKE